MTTGEWRSACGFAAFSATSPTKSTPSRLWSALSLADEMMASVSRFNWPASAAS